MAKILKIAETKDLPPGKAAAFTVEGLTIALFNIAGTYYAIDDTCPHSGGPLSEGEVQVKDLKVTCPWHGADFDLKTGAVLSPPAFDGVRSYKVSVNGNDIQIELE
jgi:nitrite reductase/ring-hydroxylating ferredoxin subunit